MSGYLTQVFPGCFSLLRLLYKCSFVFAAVSSGPCSSSPSELLILGFLLTADRNIPYQSEEALFII